LIEQKGKDGSRGSGCKNTMPFISHWTPCKDEEGHAKYVILLLAPEKAS